MPTNKIGKKKYFFRKILQVPRGNFFSKKILPPQSIGNPPKRVLTPLLFQEKKFWGSYFGEPLSGAPSQKSEPIFGKMLTPKNLGCRPLAHVVGTFPLRPIVYGSKFGGRGLNCGHNEMSENRTPSIGPPPPNKLKS